MKKVSLAVVAALLFAVSCSDETTVFENPQDSIDLELDTQTLESSIVYDNSGVLEILEEDVITGKSSKGANDQAGDYPLTLVAQIDPPSFSGGENLTATDVFIDGNFAYVSYNTAGEDYKGGLDIVNISDPNNPYLSSRAYSYDKDLNAVHYNGGYVYIVGGTDAEQSALATANSVIIRVAAFNGRLDTSDLTYVYQEGFNATDIEVTANGVYVSSGKDGYIIHYDRSSLAVVKEASFADLRSFAIQDSKIAVLDASVGVRILNSDFSEASQIAINSDFRLSDKRTIDFDGDHIIVSEGANGAGIYSATSGSLIEYIPILINPSGVAQSDIVTNAVAKNEEIVLMANGGAGLCLAEDQGDNTNLFGIIELSGSTNYVASKGDYIFAASGRSGLQIIKLNRPSDSLEASCIGIPVYSGRRNLTVNVGENLAYRGSKRFNTVTVNGELLLCGSWTVSNAATINEDATFSMNGTFVVGRNNKRKNVTVDDNATFRVEGNLTIYGDLILNDGATLEFLGEDSVVNIFGRVRRAATAEVIGTFDDVRNKF